MNGEIKSYEDIEKMYNFGIGQGKYTLNDLAEKYPKFKDIEYATEMIKYAREKMFESNYYYIVDFIYNTPNYEEKLNSIWSYHDIKTAKDVENRIQEIMKKTGYDRGRAILLGIEAWYLPDIDYVEVLEELGINESDIDFGDYEKRL